MARYVIGLDFGTESVRALLVNAAGGAIKAMAVKAYAGGVIDKALPGSSVPLPTDFALQNPADWLACLEDAIHDVLTQSRVPTDDVIGLGVDFTSCTILPAKANGTPLCQYKLFRNNPHSWPKLWKHHAAWKQAEEINAAAAARRELWLPRCGGAVYSEWAMPKALQIVEEAPDVYRAAERICEGADWITWQLTGRLVRNACSAGYKAQWNKREGFPSPEFLKALNPGLGDLFTGKFAGEVVPPGSLAGRLTAGWARRLGLKAGTPVATGIIDAHGAVLGGGITGPGILFMTMGTSTCHMLMSGKEVCVEGISGVVEDGIMPGFFGYEAGQASVGDIFGWFVDSAVPPAYLDEARNRGCSVHDLLSEKAAEIGPGRSGLLALDWWNGNRCTLGDADLSGLVLGYTVATRPEEVYRALIEATAFGARVIKEAFTGQGVSIDHVMAGGGLTRNNCLMQIYADILGCDIAVSSTEHASAMGAAMLGAVAAGEEQGGYGSLPEAVAKMAPPPARVFHPVHEHVEVYDTLYGEYRRLYDYFGKRSRAMKVLRRLRRGQLDEARNEAKLHGGHG
jgi:L-ribulokinase